MALSRVDKFSRWRSSSINDQGLTEKASANLAGEPVANLYRWEKDPQVYSKSPKTFGRASRRLSWYKRLKRCVIRIRLGVSVQSREQV